MFLLPLLISITCDIVTFYLYSKLNLYDEDETESKFLTFILTTDIIRLFCIPPYLFHLSTGRRIKASWCYKLFHIISILILCCKLLTDEKLYWIILLGNLSAVSHLAMLFHISSTAPEEIKNDGILAYAAAWRYTSHWEDMEHNEFFEDDFIKDIQNKLLKTKTHWTSKLEELNLPKINQSFTNFITPFRVLLHLYAYKDVLSNGELDSLYKQNSGSIVIFYIPQLLSFLVHGAYLNAPQLEYWILEKCEDNLLFAHVVFWFLRSWCLKLQTSENEDLVGTKEKYPIKGVNFKRKLRSLSVGKLDDMRLSSNEEYRMIENLMLRVMTRAEKAVGDIVHDEANHTVSSPFAVVDAIKSGQIPIHPTTGLPSSKHINAITTSTFPSSNLFLSTPQFFDALLSIADDLMLVSRPNRTLELRHLLQQLEYDLLPSNVIYVPFGSSNKIWRIVSSESIALSTKERVPCFITLEVIAYDKQVSNDQQIVRKWQTKARDAQRLNTFLQRIRLNTTKGFKRIQGDVTNHMKNIRGNNYCATPSCTSGNSNDFSMPDYHQQTSDTSFETSHSPLPTYQDTLSPHDTTFPQRNDIEHCYDYQTLSPKVSSAMGQWVSPPTKKSRSDEIPNPPFYNLPTLTRLQQPSLIDNKPSYDTLQASSSGESEAEVPITSNTPPTVVFKENWSDKSKRLRQSSAYGHHPGWKLLPILIKSNDDLRQEQLASQLLRRMATILARANVPVWLYPYDILALTNNGGIIEAVPDTISLDSLKRNDPHFTSLKDFFNRHFAPIGSDAHANARANFIESLAAYSIICYLLQIKDRHNGNILLDNKGHIIHIDFGFLFLSSPGKNSGFEKAPFKLTTDFVSVMDGPNSPLFKRFRHLCTRTFLELRKHCYQILLMVEMISQGNADLPCFCGRPKLALEELKGRFRLDLSDGAVVEFVNGLVDESLENWRTRWYDRYQRFCVGVL